jgi:hypothetical protein
MDKAVQKQGIKSKKTAKSNKVAIQLLYYTTKNQKRKDIFTHFVQYILNIPCLFVFLVVKPSKNA